MEDISNYLTVTGLTKSEIRVYMALLNLGEFYSKSKIVEKSTVSSSKIYEILNKLIVKGLVSTIIKNKVKNFVASPPSKLKELISGEKRRLADEERAIDKVLPSLNYIYKKTKDTTSAEIFLGWEGMNTAYRKMLDNFPTKEEVLILGASKGENIEKTKKFFEIYSSQAKIREIHVRTIFNEDSRQYVSDMEKELRINFNKKFILKTAPVELAITKDMVGIIILKEEPILILIHDKETAESFKVYFEELWKLSKT